MWIELAAAALGGAFVGGTAMGLLMMSVEDKILRSVDAERRAREAGERTAVEIARQLVVQRQQQVASIATSPLAKPGRRAKPRRRS